MKYSYINYYSQDTRERENRDRKQCTEMKVMHLQRASDCCREVDFFRKRKGQRALQLKTVLLKNARLEKLIYMDIGCLDGQPS